MRFDTPVSIPPAEVERVRRMYRAGRGVLCPGCLHQMRTSMGSDAHIPYSQRHYRCAICRRVLLEAPAPGDGCERGRSAPDHGR